MSNFIDSGIFIGAFYEGDQYHKDAKEILQRLYSERCFTSVYVLDEFVSYLTGKARDRDRSVRRED